MSLNSFTLKRQQSIDFNPVLSHEPPVERNTSVFEADDWFDLFSKASGTMPPRVAKVRCRNWTKAWVWSLTNLPKQCFVSPLAHYAVLTQIDVIPVQRWRLDQKAATNVTDISWSVMSGPFSLFTQNKINDNVSYVLLCQGKGVVVSITLTCKYNIIFFSGEHYESLVFRDKLYK